VSRLCSAAGATSDGTPAYYSILQPACQQLPSSCSQSLTSQLKPYKVTSFTGAASPQYWSCAYTHSSMLCTGCRASKDDLRNLPPLKRTVTLLDFAPEHAATYNQLVEVVRRNLLFADFNDEVNHLDERAAGIPAAVWLPQFCRSICNKVSDTTLVSHPHLITLQLTVCLEPAHEEPQRCMDI
jgi:hypothetical protein